MLQSFPGPLVSVCENPHMHGLLVVISIQLPPQRIPPITTLKKKKTCKKNPNFISNTHRFLLRRSGLVAVQYVHIYYKSAWIQRLRTPVCSAWHTSQNQVQSMELRSGLKTQHIKNEPTDSSPQAEACALTCPGHTVQTALQVFGAIIIPSAKRKCRATLLFAAVFTGDFRCVKAVRGFSSAWMAIKPVHIKYT